MRFTWTERRPFLSAVRLQKLAILCFIPLASSCSKEMEGPVVQPSAEVGEKALDIDLAQYAHILREFPLHPLRDPIAKLLLDAVPSTVSEPPEQYLISAYPDTPIGIYFLERQIEARLSASPADGRAFCEQILEQYKGNGLHYAAYSHLLDILADHDPTAYAQSIEKARSDGDAKLQRVALLHEARRFERQNKTHEAARKYVEFWTLFPEIVESMGLRDKIIAILKDGDLFLEAEMLASTQSPSAVSGLLLKPEASGSNPVFQNAWAIFQTEDSTFPDPVSTIDRLTSTSARVYALAQAGMTAYYCKKAGDSQRLLGLAVEEANVPSQSEEKPFLLAMLVAICKPLVLSHSPKSEFGRWQESEYRVSTTKLTAPLQRLVAVFNELTQESRALDPELLEHLAEGLCKSLARGEYKQGFIDLYSHLSYQRPPDAATSRFLLTLGEKYEQDFALPVEAAATYQQVYEKYPETAEARKAKLAQIRVLYESKLYDEAYLAAEEVAASPSLDETDRTTGKFMSAFCQGGMGQTEEARGAMAELVELYPQHAIAPQGLYWLATTAMANQEQSAAIEYLRALVERYPDSSFEERARKVMAALQETGKVQ